MNMDRFRGECECSMKHEKPESFPDDYKPQCECSQLHSVETFLAACKPKHFKTKHWFDVGFAERKRNGTVSNYVAMGRKRTDFEDARNELQIILMDNNRRGIIVPPDEFCIIEHTETFYLV